MQVDRPCAVGPVYQRQRVLRVNDHFIPCIQLSTPPAVLSARNPQPPGLPNSSCSFKILLGRYLFQDTFPDIASLRSPSNMFYSQVMLTYPGMDLHPLSALSLQHRSTPGWKLHDVQSWVLCVCVLSTKQKSGSQLGLY